MKSSAASNGLGTLTLSRFHFKTNPIKDNIDGEIKRVVMSTISGGTVLLGRELWEKIAAGDFVGMPVAVLRKLKDDKILVEKSFDELNVVLEENRKANDSPEKLSIVIQPTNSCQLGCVYCGQSHGNIMMSAALQKAIVERVAYQLRKGGRRALEVAWFGAEPLMAMDAIRTMTPELKTLAENNRAAYAAGVVTNGVQLTPSLFAELTEKLGVERVEVTLDGAGAFHDKRRPTKQGRKSCERILKNLSEIFAMSKNEKIISIRCNVDKTNLDGVPALIDKIESIGGKEKITHFYIAPVHNWGNSASTGMSAQEFADFEAEVLAYLLQRGFETPLLPRRIKSTCLATRKDCELVDVYGEVHKCTETSYVKAYERSHARDEPRNIHASGILGTLNTNIDAEHERNPARRFMENISIFPCGECFLFPSCGGGCPKQWREGCAPCPSVKLNLEKRLLLALATKRLGSRSQEPEVDASGPMPL